MTEMADGGIRLGTSASPVAYNSENAQRRIEEIRDNSRGRELTHDEDTEMAALLRAMTTMGGGRGKLSQIVRNSNEVGVGEANHGFMRSLGRAYSNDAAVQSAVNGSDVRARMYLDNFVPGGSGTQPGFNQNFNEYYDASTASGSAHITAAMGDIKTYAEGLNQNDKVATEYIDTLASRPDARRTLQEIFDDPQLYNSIHVSVRNHLNTVAALHGVTGPSAHEVTIAHPTGGPTGGPTGTGHSPGPSWP